MSPSAMKWSPKEFDAALKKGSPLPQSASTNDLLLCLGYSSPDAQKAEKKKTPAQSSGEIIKSFLDGRSRWIDEPVISKWRNPSPEVLAKLKEVEQLYQEWRQVKPRPFDPTFDPLWLETAKTLQKIGFPWYNNNLNPPDVCNPSWPFNFQEVERMTVMAKGSRVSDPDAAGYTATWSESSCWCIRALNQDLMRQSPEHQPVFLTDKLEPDVAKLSEAMFGLEWHQVDLGKEETMDKIKDWTSNGDRPIIFAATLANSSGESDDMKAVDAISRQFSLVLHVDASRVFDYLTTASEELRQTLNLPRLRLQHTQLGTHGCFINGEILAATIVAGGSNAFLSPPPVVALRPRTLGSATHAIVEYVRGADTVLAGSRCTFSPQMLGLQELRFGHDGFREVFQGCADKRQLVIGGLRTLGVSFHAPLFSQDVIIETADSQQGSALADLGAKALGNNKFLLAIQPSVKAQDIESLLSCFLSEDDAQYLIVNKFAQIKDTNATYTVPEHITRLLQAKLQKFKVWALGPVLGHFLSVQIPQEWAATQAKEILERKKQEYGLVTQEARKSFRAAFTTGSTMGNRIGIHAALDLHPDAHVYFSASCHFSVKKTVTDCDALSSCWKPGRLPRYGEIPTNLYGRMIPEKLIEQVLLHKAESKKFGEEYKLILFANFGTTFTGGRDDIMTLTKELAKIGVTPSYIHVDGALDLGFVTDGVRLGPPGEGFTGYDVPIIQGLTMSHHKAFGTMVSGEVIFYDPHGSDSTLALTPDVEPRAVLDMWLMEKMYTTAGIKAVWAYCLENAQFLQSSLEALSIPTFYSDDSIITVLERQPPWLVKDFGLAPEGDWVHFITMPHVPLATVKSFIREVELIDLHCGTVIEQVATSLDSSLNQSANLKRVTCRSDVATRVLDIASSTILGDCQLQEMREEHEVNTARQIWVKYIHGSMCFTAVDDKGEPLVVFLSQAEGDRTLTPGVILVKSSLHQNAEMIRDVAMQLYDHLAMLQHVELVFEPWSFQVCYF
ncbi:Histidine decarboxylase-like protein [Cladobotryum mycophilum]|uniref:Histidine decarboxylase-like protein n=1 Tax=Cladobotryum mycophilum TaxID=491253 RepID=A0ABR0SCJ6_9HYPO